MPMGQALLLVAIVGAAVLAAVVLSGTLTLAKAKAERLSPQAAVVSPSAVGAEEPGNPAIALPKEQPAPAVDASGVAEAEAALRAAARELGTARPPQTQAAQRAATSSSTLSLPSRAAGLSSAALNYRVPPRARGNRGATKTLIFVIDDAGNNYVQLEPFLKLPFSLTIAVLPDLSYSEKDAKAVIAAGKELILHQPMQAIGGQNPGPGALTIGMGADEVRSIIEANLATVPGAVGMNNHMGSAATSDLSLMEEVTAVAKARGIYYLDSLTVSDSAVPIAARREGIRYWERSVFLDNSTDRVSIVRAVEDGKRLAAKNGSAIMIGHVWSADLAQTLMDLYPRLVEEGFSLSTISRFMLSEAAADNESSGH
jgi:polysaccharide deacetylase 2 family uncharacterized protein YibQ